MATNIIENIYLRRNNKIVLQLRKNGVVQDLANVTKVRLVCNRHLEFDSSVDSTAFDWTTVATQLDIKIGLKNIKEGVYPSVLLIVYDANNTSGIVWSTFDLTVQDSLID